MQLSVTLNQKEWFLAGDVDDCWVLSSLMLVSAVTPWLGLPNTREFREAAGVPDVPGEPNGGNPTVIVRGITGMWPTYSGRLRPINKGTWTGLTAPVDAGHPASVGLMTGLLPRRLQYQPNSIAHQVTIARRDNGDLALGDPLAPVYSRWATVTWTEIKAAILGYGKVRSGGTSSVYAVIGPTEMEMLPTHPKFAAAAAASQADLINQAHRDGYNAAVTDAAVIANEAAGRIEALRKA